MHRIKFRLILIDIKVVEARNVILAVLLCRTPVSGADNLYSSFVLSDIYALLKESHLA